MKTDITLIDVGIVAAIAGIVGYRDSALSVLIVLGVTLVMVALIFAYVMIRLAIDLIQRKRIERPTQL